jgi:hypothetical protein
MRCARFAAVVATLTLLLAAVPAQATPHASRCDADARVLSWFETAAEIFTEVPGPFAGFLSRHFERKAERAALRYADRCVHLNQVQVLGSHNSYHIEPVPSLIGLYLIFDDSAFELRYTHRPLDQQFGELGVRQIELDVFADPDGGLYADPVGLRFRDGFDIPVPSIPELVPPGNKVLHIQDLDWDTTCQFFVECLGVVKAWSDANPGHLPILVLVEAKDEIAPDPLGLGFAIPIEFEGPEFDTLDAEIRSVFPPGQLITPDDVRGSFGSLRDAVLTRGWPSLGDSRGKVLFALDNFDKRFIYQDGHPSLEGRVMFVDAVPDGEDPEDAAAFVKVNGPLGNEARIQDLVAQGFIVRTRSDAGTVEALTDDPTRREAALGSGAQYVSTDYEEPDPRPEFNDFVVSIPDGEPGRCNPVNAPAGCRNFALER